MPTERQSESARINGARSQGPKSVEGKEKSSRNSLRHGCTACQTILLACEDRGQFERMRAEFDETYKPATLEEQVLVAEMFAASWRIRRATTIETSLIDSEMVTEEPKVKAKFATVNGVTVLSSAFRSLADESKSLALLHRYEARLRRIRNQNYNILLRLREDRQSEPAPPEPCPAPSPDPALSPAPAGAPEVCTPPTPAAPPPAIHLIPKPEARCKVGAGSENKNLQNEPPAQRHPRRFRSRRERKIFNAARLQAGRC